MQHNSPQMRVTVIVCKAITGKKQEQYIYCYYCPCENILLLSHCLIFQYSKQIAIFVFYYNIIPKSIVDLSAVNFLEPSIFVFNLNGKPRKEGFPITETFHAAIETCIAKILDDCFLYPENH